MSTSFHRSMGSIRRKPPADYGAPPTPVSEEEHETTIHAPTPLKKVLELPPRDVRIQSIAVPTLHPPSIEDAVEPTSPIDAFRSRNPNLQPLSPKEKQEVDSRISRHSIDPTDPLKRPVSVHSPAARASSLSTVPTQHTARHSIGSTGDLKSKFKRFSQVPSKPQSSASSTLSNVKAQGFWKYHILEFGNDLYLSTNPDSKHLYCRHSPGVHVQVLYPQIQGMKERDTTGKSGFRMVFRNQNEDTDAFMSVTKSEDGKKFLISGVKSIFEDEDGSIVSIDPTASPSQLRRTATETTVPELQHRYHDPSSIKPIRYHISTTDKDTTAWNVGTIPQFKTGTSKLRNKRYIYFHTAEKDKILACFRPHESRTKKKIIKKLNSKLLPSTSFRADDNDVLYDGKDVVYYTPGDGVFQKDPPDDAPNSDKLGWITIFDDDCLKTPGNWEMALGYSLAVGFSRVLEEKKNDEI